MNDNRVCYSRIFPGPEAEAIGNGFLPSEVINDKTVVNSISHELCLNQYSNISTAEVDCRSINQLPVMKFIDNVGRYLWPILIIQFRDVFICGLVLVKSLTSQQILAEPDISAALKTLQTFVDKIFENIDSSVSTNEEHRSAAYFLNGKLPQIELFITDKIPFGYTIMNPFDCTTSQDSNSNEHLLPVRTGSNKF